MGKAPDHIRSKNLDLCHENREVIFKGAVEVPSVFQGKDSMFMRITLSDGIKFVEFNPQQVVREKSNFARRMMSLCEALGLNWNDVPFVHDWDGFVPYFTETFLADKKGMSIYAKITIDDNGWLRLGTGRCFSSKPDMVYSDQDKENIDHDEMDRNKSQDDIPF